MKNLLMALMVCGAFAATAEAAYPQQKDIVSKHKLIKAESYMDEDGQNSLRISKQLLAKHKGNEYIDLWLRLPEQVDLTGKAISVTVLSENPENIGGFYIRAYNAGQYKQAASSHYKWSPTPILSKNYTEFIVIPGKDGKQLQWESKTISGDAPTTVDRLSIHAGSPKRNVEMNFRIKSIKIIESPLVATDKFFAGLGQFKAFAKSAFTNGTQAQVKDNVLILSGTSPAKPHKPGASMYQGMRILLSNPVDVTGKKISLEYRISGPVGVLYIRGKEEHPRKTCFSFTSQKKSNDWTKIELPISGTPTGNVKREPAYDGDFTKFQSLSFIFPTMQVNAKTSVEVRNLQIID